MSCAWKPPLIPVPLDFDPEKKIELLKRCRIWGEFATELLKFILKGGEKKFPPGIVWERRTWRTPKSCGIGLLPPHSESSAGAKFPGIIGGKSGFHLGREFGGGEPFPGGRTRPLSSPDGKISANPGFFFPPILLFPGCPSGIFPFHSPF